MLQSVRDPKGNVTTFEYDALGRRTAKINFYKKEINRYIYDGNVLLHELSYPLEERPKIIADEIGRLSLDKEENTKNLTTWVFEEGSFIPQAKIVDGKTYSIISDYLGTPILSFDEKGNKVWERELDIYGNCKKGDNGFVPFLYQGQYYDEETELAYNRFRYYSPDSGTYISQDPIGLASGEPNFYRYMSDSNIELDVFGLAGTPWLPHGASQPDVISKGPHFYAGDGKTELKLKLDGNGKVDFEEVFTKDSGTSKLNKALKESREKLLKDKNWREKLLKNAGEVKNSLFNTFDRLDRARDVKKIEKALKKMCK